MALLRHELPDGSGHFDWLLAVNLRPGNEERSVVCLRTLVPPWPAPAREAILSLERVADHRGLYLWLTAPRELDERGIAHPLMRGNWRRIGAENRLLIQAHWSDGSGAVWLFNHALSQATCADLLG